MHESPQQNPSDGQPVDGQPVDGQPVDGQPADEPGIGPADALSMLDVRARRWAWVTAVLLLAAVLRLGYARNMPLSGDEASHLQIARQMSLEHDRFFWPLGTTGTNHPPGVLYLTSLALQASGENVYAVRAVFVLLSVAGLVGLYFAGAALFGREVGLLALGLAALDRHLIALAPVFLESPAVICLAPWAILLMYRCATGKATWHWLALGVLGGLGYWMSAVFLAMAPALGLFLLVRGKLPQALRSRWMYAGLAIMVAMMIPNVLWNVFHESVNYERHASKVGTLGLAPRFAVLYVGDLLMLAKDPMWIVESFSGPMYLPVYIPCQWAMGLLYLVGAAAAARYWREPAVALLLSVLIAFAVPVTVLDASEPWNEFTWGSSTVFVAILLTSFVLFRIPVKKLRLAAIAAALASASVVALLFLAGPKWAYFCPDVERYYVGRMLAIQSDRARTSEGIYQEASALTQEALIANPNSAAAWYFDAYLSVNSERQFFSLQRSAELQPRNHPVQLIQARELIQQGQLNEARAILEGMLDSASKPIDVLRLLVDLETKAGRSDAALSAIQRWLAAYPADERAHRSLFLHYDAQGEAAEAELALEAFTARHPLGPAAAYLSLATHFMDEQEAPEKAARFLDEAIASPPRLPEHCIAIAIRLERLGRLEAAVQQYENALRIGSKDPRVYFWLAQLAEELGQQERAMALYRRVLEMDPGHSGVIERLGRLQSEELD